jgi:hypothetical protein
MLVHLFWFVLSCVLVEALYRADLLSKESYRLCIGLRNLKDSLSLTKGCITFNNNNNNNNNHNNNNNNNAFRHLFPFKS